MVICCVIDAVECSCKKTQVVLAVFVYNLMLGINTYVRLLLIYLYSSAKALACVVWEVLSIV